MRLEWAIASLVVAVLVVAGLVVGLAVLRRRSTAPALANTPTGDTIVAPTSDATTSDPATSGATTAAAPEAAAPGRTAPEAAAPGRTVPEAIASENGGAGGGASEGSLSARLRAATDDAHRAAESSPFIGALLDGSLSRDAFTALVTQHWFIYTALEDAAEAMCYDQLAGGFVTDALARVPALEQDLAFLVGPDWRSTITPLPATRAYVARLASVASVRPEAFIAHHYTRYLGDLSGGAFVAAAVRKHYGLTGTEGTSFYEFGDIPKRGQFKRDYRERLDALPLDPDQTQLLIDEAVLAFDLNRRVFAELARPAVAGER